MDFDESERHSTENENIKYKRNFYDNIFVEKCRKDDKNTLRNGIENKNAKRILISKEKTSGHRAFSVSAYCIIIPFQVRLRKIAILPPPPQMCRESLFCRVSPRNP